MEPLHRRFLFSSTTKREVGEIIMSNSIKHRDLIRCAGAVLVLSAASFWSTNAQSQALTTTYQSTAASASDKSADEVQARFRRQVVDYPSKEAPGSIIVDTQNTYLYFVLGGGKAMRYGIGVGREGFTWSGTKSIERKSEWPDWIPPTEMLERQPYLPRFMAGGPGNPLGARAMYLGGTVYRIHGTNAPSTIGMHVSSGCIRMVNEDVIDLYNRAHVGTKVVVLPNDTPPVSQSIRISQVVPHAKPAGAVIAGSSTRTLY
jgi:lipoprotein-anchoring transpeptidase ErfK/SrfK